MKHDNFYFFLNFFENRLNETFVGMVKSLNYFIKFIYGNGFKDISPPKKINEKRKPKHKKLLIDGGRALFMTQAERETYIKEVLANRTGKSLGASIPYNLDTAQLMALLRIGRLERALGQQYVKELLGSMGGQDGIIKQVPTGTDLRAFILSHRPLAKEWYKMNNSRPIRTPSNIPSTPYHKVKNGLESKYKQAKPIYRKDVSLEDLIPVITARKKREIERKQRKENKEKEKRRKAKGKTTREQPPQLKAYQARRAARKQAIGLQKHRIQQAAENFQKVLQERKERVATVNKGYYKKVMDDAKSKAESRELSEKEKKFINDLQKKFKEHKDTPKSKKSSTSKSKKQQSSSPPPQPPPSTKPTSSRSPAAVRKELIDELDAEAPVVYRRSRTTGMDVIKYSTR